jgi:hypothetical protein
MKGDYGGTMMHDVCEVHVSVPGHRCQPKPGEDRLEEGAVV